MNFLDEVEIIVAGGKGGKGSASFLKAANLPKGGPHGGDGGAGGSIIVVTDPSLNTLVDFRFKKKFFADEGKSGAGFSKTGASAKNIYLKVPLGTEIYKDEALLVDLSTEREFVLAKGGAGGKGNLRFKSSINRTPRQFTYGEPGEEHQLTLKLKLLSDVGLLGMPNAGKSSFLAKISNARPKVADYEFTTLYPQLGVVNRHFKELVVADIPGLIEFASKGIGLGIQFLKHLERCNTLLHLIDITADDIASNYTIIRQELASFSLSLENKREIIVLNKIDLIQEEELEEKINQIRQVTENEVFPISNFSNKGIEDLVKFLFIEVKSSFY